MRKMNEKDANEIIDKMVELNKLFAKNKLSTANAKMGEIRNFLITDKTYMAAVGDRVVIF